MNRMLTTAALAAGMSVAWATSCLAGGSSCCSAQSFGTLGCGDAACEALICAEDPFCCTTSWDSICAGAAQAQCAVCQPALGACCLPDGTCVDGVTQGQCETPPGGCGNCATGGNDIGCSDPKCEAIVCEVDPFCCETAWDGICDAGAQDLCDCDSDSGLGGVWQGEDTDCTDALCDDDVVLMVPIDIRPGSCPNPFNANAQGVIPIAVLGSDSFDVGMIDVASVSIWRVDGVGGAVTPLFGPPGPSFSYADVAGPHMGKEDCACASVAPDGFMDLDLKFSNAAIRSTLELSGLPRGTVVELAVSGVLNDGTAFVGSDCVVIVGGGGGSPH